MQKKQKKNKLEKRKYLQEMVLEKLSIRMQKLIPNELKAKVWNIKWLE